MNYENHFLKEDIAHVDNEVSCLVQLCGLIALNVKEGNIEIANDRKDDLLKSLKEITELNLEKQKHDESWLKWKQIEGVRQQTELINEHLRLNDKEVANRRSWY